MLALLLISIFVIGFLLLFTSSSRRRDYERYMRYMDHHRPMYQEYPPSFYPSGRYDSDDTYRLPLTAVFLAIVLLLFFLIANASQKDITEVSNEKIEKSKDS